MPVIADMVDTTPWFQAAKQALLFSLSNPKHTAPVAVVARLVTELKLGVVMAKPA
jgi:hypothetical protein